MAFNPDLMKFKPTKRHSYHSGHVGRPSSLSDSTIAEIELLYQHNIPAVDVARKYGLSRQQVYYYYKIFELKGVERQPQPTIEDVLNGTWSDSDKAYA